MTQKGTYTVDEAKKKLEHYCAYQERCHQEVVNKLRGMKMIPQAIDVILVHLIQHNYLNEERFAKTYVRGKLRFKKWGKRRLTSELKKNDISKININQALTEIDNTEYVEIFNDLAEKRLNSLREKDKYQKKRMLADYLLYRGWETYMVYDKVNELIP